MKKKYKIDEKEFLTKLVQVELRKTIKTDCRCWLHALFNTDTILNQHKNLQLSGIQTLLQLSNIYIPSKDDIRSLPESWCKCLERMVQTKIEPDVFAIALNNNCKRRLDRKGWNYSFMRLAHFVHMLMRCGDPQQQHHLIDLLKQEKVKRVKTLNDDLAKVEVTLHDKEQEHFLHMIMKCEDVKQQQQMLDMLDQNDLKKLEEELLKANKTRHKKKEKGKEEKETKETKEIDEEEINEKRVIVGLKQRKKQLTVLLQAYLIKTSGTLDPGLLNVLINPVFKVKLIEDTNLILTGGVRGCPEYLDVFIMEALSLTIMDIARDELILIPRLLACGYSSVRCVIDCISPRNLYICMESAAYLTQCVKPYLLQLKNQPEDESWYYPFDKTKRWDSLEIYGTAEQLTIDWNHPHHTKIFHAFIHLLHKTKILEYVTNIYFWNPHFSERFHAIVSSTFKFKTVFIQLLKLNLKLTPEEGVPKKLTHKKNKK